MGGKNMDSSLVTAVVHFNGFVTIIDESVIFMCDYPALVYLPDTIRGFYTVLHVRRQVS